MKTLAWCSLSKPYCCWLVYIGDLLRRCEQSMIVGGSSEELRSFLSARQTIQG